MCSSRSSSTAPRSPPAYISRWRARNSSTTASTSEGSATRDAPAVQPEHPGDRAGRQQLVVRCLPSKLDHGALERAHERECARPGGWPRWNRPVFASRLNKATETADKGLRDPRVLVPDGVVLPPELNPQAHQDGAVACLADKAGAGPRG